MANHRCGWPSALALGLALWGCVAPIGRAADRPLWEFGDLLHQAWQAKRSLDGGVSNLEIDGIYEQGRAAGAMGGKLLGAGGGGFMLFFAPPSAHPKLSAVFADRQLLKVKLNAPGSQIIFS